ncbi:MULTISPECIES: hypothetical protein [unclassified Streptomyces]|uniref:hypothetical protein n=1 Tax=unclassified Streptomyces TaxID=2593676 RepID=UPI002E345A65|nr:hypothetical protein [Streptomyces sp. NBC_01460]WSS31444.1 hypothetical protein OG770_36930 [Streptomyces sp. NBC_01185]
MSRRTTLQLASPLALVLAVSIGGTAAAHDGGKGWDNHDTSGYTMPQALPGGVEPTDANCAFLSGGEPWTAKEGLAHLTPGADGKISLDVKGDGGACTVSLASYRAHGSTWATSGLQILTDFATATVADGGTGTLTIAVPDAGCFAQIDLYHGSTRYDGGTGTGHGPAPDGPNKPVIGDKLIAAWNGPTGGKDCTAETTPSTTAPTTPAVTTPAPATSSASAIPSTAPSTPATSATPTPTATTSSAAPAPQGGDESLATTGNSGTGLLAGGAAALLLAGGGLLVAQRRRTAARTK